MSGKVHTGLERRAEVWNRLYSQRVETALERREPAPALTWALAVWPHLTGNPRPRYALQIGCGSGRNAVYLSQQGVRVLGLDIAAVAIELAHRRVAATPLSDPPEFRQHDVGEGIPLPSAEVDLVVDILVFNERLLPAERRAHLQEIHRVLAPGGRLLLAVPALEDGFYQSCQHLTDPEPSKDRLTVHDPASGISTVLFSMDSLEREVGKELSLEMCWFQKKTGLMYGRSFERQTLVTIWRPRQGTST